MTSTAAKPSRAAGAVLVSQHGKRVAEPGDPLLAVEDVTVRFGGIVALDGVSFAVAPGAICGLIGPNGAGKTTLFNCINRLYRVEQGAIRFAGHDLLAVPRHGIAALGIARTFQNLALFRSMSVRRNIMVGGHCRSRGGFLGSALRMPIVEREEAALAERCAAIIAELELDAVADRPIENLTFAMQKRVELARALAAAPKLLLLDEPASGLNHEEVERLRALIAAIRDHFGVTILLVEHHMNLVMRISDRVVALDFGRKIAEGSPAEVQRDPQVARAYLGTA